jgi:hypothetical protein
MATGADVLTLLCPNSEWTITGNNYDSIDWFGKSPAITREQFETSFEKTDVWLAEKKANIAATKQALLDKLGITEEEAKLLLS